VQPVATPFVGWMVSRGGRYDHTELEGRSKVSMYDVRSKNYLEKMIRLNLEPDSRHEKPESQDILCNRSSNALSPKAPQL
jgi:hypothetical protein